MCNLNKFNFEINSSNFRQKYNNKIIIIIWTRNVLLGLNRLLSACIVTKSIFIFFWNHFSLPPVKFYFYLISIWPGSNTLLAIRPHKSSFAISFPIPIITIKFQLIWPNKFPLSMHFKILPFAFINATIWPMMNSITFNSIFFEFTVIILVIIPFKNTLTFFHTVSILSFIKITIIPKFSSKTIFCVVQPITFWIPSF